MILIAVKCAVQKPARVRGLSQKGNSTGADAANTEARKGHKASMGNDIATQPGIQLRMGRRSFHHVNSKIAMTPSRLTALSLESIPAVVTATSAMSHPARARALAASLLFRYIRKPLNMAIAASRSDRPTMFVTDSVSTGWTAHNEATNSAGQNCRIRRKARA